MLASCVKCSLGNIHGGSDGGEEGGHSRAEPKAPGKRFSNPEPHGVEAFKIPSVH